MKKTSKQLPVSRAHDTRPSPNFSTPLEMTLKERKIFLGGNTPDGFVGFYDQVVDMYDLKKLYILKGGSGVGKSTFIRNFITKVVHHAQQQSVDGPLTIDWIYCSQEPTSLDGAIIHELKLGIIDGTRPHMTDPKYPGIVDQIIDLAQFIDNTKLINRKQELQLLMTKKKSHYNKAYEQLSKARQYHNKIEAIYTPCVDFNDMNKLLDRLVEEVV